jgi:catechol 2,3-dioxygenase-like lactoylglutathione lyase family enzyme
MTRAIATAGFVVMCGLVLGAAPAVTTVGFRNVHILVPDPAVAADWYIKHLGAAPGASAGRVAFGKNLVVFIKTDKRPSRTENVMDHFALSYSDVRSRMKTLEAAGVPIVAPLSDEPGLFTHGFVRDPWGTKIEVLQDPGQLGMHHVHLRVADPAATLKWYEEMFGGQRDKLNGVVDGVRYTGVWILADKRTAQTPRAKAARNPQNGIPGLWDYEVVLQNIGLEISAIDEGAAELKRRGATCLAEPTAPTRPVRSAFFEDPDGVLLELVQLSRP